MADSNNWRTRGSSGGGGSGQWTIQGSNRKDRGRGGEGGGRSGEGGGRGRNGGDRRRYDRDGGGDRRRYDRDERRKPVKKDLVLEGAEFPGLAGVKPIENKEDSKVENWVGKIKEAEEKAKVDEEAAKIRAQRDKNNMSRQKGRVQDWKNRPRDNRPVTMPPLPYNHMPAYVKREQNEFENQTPIIIQKMMEEEDDGRDDDKYWDVMYYKNYHSHPDDLDEEFDGLEE